MKQYVRRMTKRNDRTFAHTISIPAELVRKFGMSDMMVQVIGKNNEIHIKKINNSITNMIDEEEDENVTIHY